MSISTHNFCLVFITLLLFVTTSAHAQISHGGHPLPLDASTRLSSSQVPFVEMPAFDAPAQEAAVRAQSTENRLKSLEFAHKFHTFLRPDNSGVRFTTSDNVTVWRVGIRSKGAYSLNILFSKFRLPEGAKVFIYNTSQSEVLGAYTHQNNSDLNLLPVQPLSGDELIVEYQEPADASFKGEIEVGEVNHDFIGILRDAVEPRDPKQSCHPNLVCYPEDVVAGSGVVVLVINGTTYCTGVLVNNSKNDGTPYLLTATHCLNNNYCSSFLRDRKYDLVAGSIVAFFGYQSPVCQKEIRGNTQMTLASADSVLIVEDHDISLLKLKDMPPREYKPYHVGWNLSSSPPAPFHGIHHPNGGTKKVVIDNDPMSKTMVTFTVNNNCGNSVTLKSRAHWDIEAWDVGTTEAGSSGSPLLDKNKRIIGTLTGGSSFCSSPRGPDQYASLYKAWEVTGSLGNPKSLRDYLAPTDALLQQTDGLDFYANDPVTKVSNYLPTDSVVQTYHNSVPMFTTNNTYGYSEFAEEFATEKPAQLQGIFIASAATNNIEKMDIRVKIYADNNDTPGAVLLDAPLSYSFQNIEKGTFYNRDMEHNVENYLHFAKPIEVSGKFYIAYSDAKATSNGFSVLNVIPRKIGSGKSSTSWIKNAGGWIRTSENTDNPINTSFTIAPYVVGKGLTNLPTPTETKVKVYFHLSENRIFIESSTDLVSWEVFYASGQKVASGKAKSSINRTFVDMGTLPKGVYVVKVTTIDSVDSHKILIW